MNEPNPAEEALKRIRRIATAYANVFGVPEKRSEDQKLVMEDIEGFCHAYRPCVELRTDGSVAPDNHVLHEGRRTVWLRIRGQIIASQQPTALPVTVSRQHKSP